MEESDCAPATDRTFSQIMWDEFFILTAVGGSFTFTHTTGWKIFTAVNTTLAFTISITATVLLAYTSYLVKNNLSLLSQTSHMFIVGVIFLTANTVLMMRRKTLLKFRNFFDNPYGVAAYSRNEFFDSLIKKTNRKKNVLIVTWVCLYGLCGTVGSSQPIINSVFGVSGEVPRVDGVWTNLPFALWVPHYDLEKDYAVWLVVYTFESVFLMYGAVIVTAIVILCFTLSDRLLDQLGLAIHGIENLDHRAMEMFRAKYPGRDWKKMPREYEDCYYDCVAQCVQHHLRTMRIFETLMDLFNIPCAVPFFGGALMLGMALITITSGEDPRPGPKAWAVSLAFSEGYNMYQMCAIGQDFQDMSEQLFQSLYFTRWYNRSTRCTKAVIIMRYGCSRPIQMMAAKILNMNMELFGDLVRSAYSIFNLKSASSSD